MKKDLKTHWNNIFTEGKDFRPINIGLVDKILEFIFPNQDWQNKTILDVGCGTGELLEKFFQKGLMVVGIDISDVALGKAKERVPRAKFIQGDIENTDFGGLFDIIISKLVYAFIQDKKIFLDKIKQFLSKEGVFVLITPVLDGEFEYDERMKRISVDRKETEELLKKQFKEVFLFSEFSNEGNENWKTVVWICSNH